MEYQCHHEIDTKKIVRSYYVQYAVCEWFFLSLSNGKVAMTDELSTFSLMNVAIQADHC